MLPIVQIPGQQFNLLGGQRFNGQVCNRLGQRFAAVIQILDFLVGLGKQGGVGSGQRIKQFFNLGLYLCKLHLIGGNLWIDFSLAAPKQFELPELFSHSCENELFKLILAECAAPRTTLVVGPLGTAEVFIARGVVGRFECVPAFSAFDFPSQPSVAGLAPILEGDVGHQLLAAPQPNVGGYEALVGRNHKDLVFQALVLVLLHIPPLVEITAVCPGEVGGVIDYHSTLTFEELIRYRKSIGIVVNTASCLCRIPM